MLLQDPGTSSILAYENENQRGFAFIESEVPDDAQAAVDHMNGGEMFG